MTRWTCTAIAALVLSGLGIWLDDRDYFYDDLRVQVKELK